MDLILERDELGLCPVCKVKLTDVKEEDLASVKHKDKVVLVCKRHLEDDYD